MNKRQAKKAFKKKYGITPKQAAELACKVTDSTSCSLCSIMNDTFKQMSDALPEIMKSIQSVCDALGEYLRSPEFAEQVEQIKENKYDRKESRT